MSNVAASSSTRPKNNHTVSQKLFPRNRSFQSRIKRLGTRKTTRGQTRNTEVRLFRAGPVSVP